MILLLALTHDPRMLKVYLTSSCDMLERIGGKHHAFAVKVKDIFVDPMKAFAEYQKKARKTVRFLGGNHTVVSSNRTCMTG